MSSMVESGERTLGVLRPLMAQRGAAGTPEEFYWAVNRAFHAEEARVYDRVHQEMWRSLPMVWRLLSQDLRAASQGREPISVLDVGCGTGMAAVMLLQTPLAGRIQELVLLDPSAEMLAQARKRRWPRAVPTRHLQGTVRDVPVHSRFDLIIASSVLHHVPDLPDFLGCIERLQDRGGRFIHLQDPHRDAVTDPGFRRRCRELDDTVRSRERRGRFHPLRLARRVAQRIGVITQADYLVRVNRRLLHSGVISVPLTAEEIWSVTDIHVPNLPFSIGRGISLEEIGRHLPSYRLVARRSYGFWGKLHSELPAGWQEAERRMIESGEPGGAWIAGAWQKRT